MKTDSQLLKDVLESNRKLKQENTGLMGEVGLLQRGLKELNLQHDMSRVREMELQRVITDLVMLIDLQKLRGKI
jgi:hypothetical protein